MAQGPTVLTKDLSQLPRPPVLRDYEATCRTFRWEDARAALDGLPGGGLNIAWEAVGRHAWRTPDRVALRWVGRDGTTRRDVTCGELAGRTSRFARALGTAGVGPGDRVFLLLGRIPALVESLLGALQARAIVSPLFSAFGPEPIRARMELGGGQLLVTTPSLYRRKVAPVRDALPALRTVLLVSDDGAPIPPPDLPAGCACYQSALAAESETFPVPPTDPEDPALLHFTSGTTGTPKGALHVHGAVVHHAISGRFALDLQPGDIYWCTADPGWVTGTSYGVISPLVNGVTLLFYEGEFDAEAWYRLLQRERVNVWYTAPTAVRMMMKAGADLARQYPLPDLRFVASVGEPLHAEGVSWGLAAFGRPIHDNWWQTETGGILIANFLSTPIRPGSMGRPLPGIEAAVVARNPDGTVTPVPHANQEGEIAIVAGWPSMMRGYWNDEARTRKCLATGTDGKTWYLSGDLARVDGDGFFWFVGRSDDVIKTSGHLVGPFEVEAVLLQHPGVAEAAVIGKPDPVALEVIKAFVALKPGFEPSEALRRELLGLARQRLGAVVAPKEVDFLPALPRTRSGKILRRLLKARELGLPEGDLSTLEADSRPLPAVGDTEPGAGPSGAPAGGAARP